MIKQMHTSSSDDYTVAPFLRVTGIGLLDESKQLQTGNVENRMGFPAHARFNQNHLSVFFVFTLDS